MIKIVKQIQKEVWICPYCRRQYDDYTQAENCAEECAEIEEPERDYSIEKYQCECCNKYYNDYKEAQECEEKHQEEQDKYYEAYMERIQKEKLQEASKHPNQTKINTYEVN